MNKGAFLGLALIAIGIFALIFNYSNNSIFSFFSGSTVTINESEVVDGSEITSIDIHSSSPSVYLIPADQEDITIELSGEVSSKLKDSFSLDVKTNRDKLRVNIERSNKTVTNFFGSTVIDAKLEVYVPEKIYDDITITTSSGKIIVEDLHANNFEMKASSGRINVSDIIAEKELDLQSSSGQIKAKNCQTKEINSKASSGTITLKNIKTTEINAATSSGKIEIVDSEGVISATASSGKITIDNEKLSGDIDVSTSSGRVDISLKEIQSALVDFRGSSGKGNVAVKGMEFEENSDNHIYGKIGSGEYKIKVRTSSGGFDLN